MFYGIISRININLKVRGRLKDEYTKSKSQGMKVGTLGRQNDQYLCEGILALTSILTFGLYFMTLLLIKSNFSF